MKKFLIDQALFLTVGIVIMILIPAFCGPVFAYIFEAIVVLCWGFLCRRILLLPLDLIIGSVSQTAYFSVQCRVDDLEFFWSTYCYVWKFYFDKDRTLKLLVPVEIMNGAKAKSDLALPEKDAKLRLTYYSLSKILLQCDPIVEARSDMYC